MKVRSGFVSNSSSSSFVINKYNLTVLQLEQLKELNFTPIGKWDDNWSIYEEGDTVRGYTSMNNGYGVGEGGLEDWLIERGYPVEQFKWEHN